MIDITLNIQNPNQFKGMFTALANRMAKTPLDEDDEVASTVFDWGGRCDLDGPYQYVTTPATYDKAGVEISPPVFASGEYWNLRVSQECFDGLLEEINPQNKLPGGVEMLGAVDAVGNVVHGSPPVPQRVWA